MKNSLKTETPETLETPTANTTELQDTTTKPSEQSLIPDFLKLAETEHQITGGAKLPDDVGGADAEAKRGRGRPAMNDDERAAARERKREADRQRRQGAKAGTKAKTKSAVVDGVDPAREIAKGNAMLVVAGLELINKAISGGEYITPPEQLAATHQVWTEFLVSEGITLPPWAQVCIISVAHVAPAFTTETGRGRLSGWWASAKAWFIKKRG